jgi:hypothetical protein
MWTCDLADAGQIYEVFSTNGDDRVGGAVQVGLLDGLNGFYKTWFPGVGIRLTHVRSGKVLQRYYQSSRLDNYQIDEVAQKIYIRAKHLSPIRAEIARVSDAGVGGYTSNWCPVDARPGTGTVTYDCAQPNGYLMLRGPGYTSKQGVADDDGEDVAYHYRFWFAYNGVAFGMRKAARLSMLPSCAVQNLTPEVVFAPISISELELGQTRQATFTISFKCDIGMGSTAPSVPGTDDNLTAFGIQASTGAYLAAIPLGYVNADTGISYLLSDNYAADPGVAKGVGISLADADTGLPMNFLSSPVAGQGLASGFPGGQGRVVPVVAANWWFQRNLLPATTSEGDPAQAAGAKGPGGSCALDGVCDREGAVMLSRQPV